MDRIEVELSESPAAPANDTRAGSVEYLLSFRRFPRNILRLVVHLGRRPVTQGLVGSPVIVEPEVGA